MKQLLLYLIIIISLISCTGTENITEKQEPSMVVETIEKGDTTLVYSYISETIPYGDEVTIILDITYPSDLKPQLNINDIETPNFIKNGVLLNIEKTDPLLIDSSTFKIEYSIIFEAFLPGKMITGPIELKMRTVSTGNTEPVNQFTITPITFTVTGDPSLSPENREPAGIINPGKQNRSINYIIYISAAVLFLILILIFIIYKIKNRENKEIPDREEKFSLLISRFKKNYITEDLTEDLRPAFRELKEIIKLSPFSSTNPDDSKKYIERCSDLCFQGSVINDRQRFNELKNMFIKIQEEAENDI